MRFEIKHRFKNSILFSCEAETQKEAVEKAVKDNASLDGACLDGAYLDNASLVGASLVGASLDNASLVGARLDGASLVGASLDNASLDGARLVGARLDGARLVGASLDGACLDGARLDGARLDNASLDGACLDGARLDGARLDGACLDPIKFDLWAVLVYTPHEARGLLAAIKEGRINGTAYEGKCACLVGTLANERHCNYEAIDGLKPNSYRPAERFFLAIKTGDTPETSQFSALAAKWVEEWITRMESAFTPVAVK
jgi:hypothetical protein